MIKANSGMTESTFAQLNQMSVEDLRALAWQPDSFSVGPRYRYQFADALTLEIARQLSDNSGLPLKEALRLIMYTMAVPSFPDAAASGEDFWLGVLSSRNTWGSQPRGSWPVTGFGPKEYWAEMHFAGLLSAVTAEISEWIARDTETYPDSDPARIIMTNVSAADRRLRKRASEMGISIAGNEFAD